MRITMIGDVGGWNSYHVGDEAMLSANIAGLRRTYPSVEITILSRDPDWSSETYDAASLLPFGFAVGAIDQELRDERLHRISSFLNGSAREPDERASKVFASIRGSDALFISGGGNLSSSWPEHLYERVALMRTAAAFGKPVIVSGQTLGPALTENENLLLSEQLRQAAFVGVRERDSLALAIAMGVPETKLFYQLDDAFFIARNSSGMKGLPRRKYVAITLHPHMSMGHSDGPSASKFIRQFEEVSRLTRRMLVFVPHHNGSIQNGDPPTDRDVGAVLARGMSVPFRLLRTPRAEEAAGIAANAELIVSSRYHPLVFGVSGCVPSLGIWTDRYTQIKLTGSLAHGGLDHWVISDQEAVEGGLSDTAASLWQVRGGTRASLESRVSSWKRQDEERWERIQVALGKSGV